MGPGPMIVGNCLAKLHADPHFPVSDFICDCGAYLAPFETMPMNGEIQSVWDVGVWNDRDTAVRTCKKRWWHWLGRGASVCGCITSGLTLHPCDALKSGSRGAICLASCCKG